MLRGARREQATYAALRRWSRMKELENVNGSASPSSPFTIRTPKAARVGVNASGEMIALVFDPGTPDTMTVLLDGAAARRIGQDLINASKRGAAE